MDGMNAIERQLSAELDQMAGSGRRIDGMAPVQAVSPRPQGGGSDPCSALPGSSSPA